jgi:hypothetical protein
MRKGLTQALMAVAVVMLAVRVMAMAPTIDDIPSPVVGDNETASPANTFVFPDAIDLTAYGNDEDANGADTSAQLMWSYEILDHTDRYRINNRDQLAPSDDPSNPPAAKRIDGPGSADDDPLGTNDAESKITIRNIGLSPIGGPNVDPGTTGILPAEIQMVTLYAGDGTTFTWKPVLFYTDNDGDDRLSGGGPPQGEPVYSETFTNTVASWGYFPSGGSITSSYDSGAGALCIQTAAAGDNLAQWSSSYGILPLVNNAVYRIRAGVNTSQTNPALVPFWDMIVNSYLWQTASSAPNTVRGLNLYGGNFMFLANTGNANAAVSGTTNEFVHWFTPAAVLTTQWNDTSETQPGPWAPSLDAENDAGIEFRILDAASNTGTNSAQATGSMCLTELMIDRFDLGDIGLVSNKLTQTQMTQGGAWNPPAAPTSAGGNTRYTVLANASVSFAGNAVTVTPGGSGDMLTLIEPGDFQFDLVSGNSVTDNYPVAMTPDTLYRVTIDMSAPTTNDQNAPPDIIFMGADTPSNELINLSYVTVQAWRHGMPKTGTPQSYVAFFYSNNGTADSNPAWFKQFRWRMMIGSNASLGGGGEPNTGAIRIHSVAVDEVAPQ